MRWTRNDVHDGMSVTSTKGDRLGKVISRDAETFVVEKGVFFPKDYELRYDHITDMGSGGISYSLSDFESRLGLMESGRASTTPRVAPSPSPSPVAAASPRASAASSAKAAASARAATSNETASREELLIPLMEEEIGIEKVARDRARADSQDDKGRGEALQRPGHA